jgi:hypothetical protein
MVRILTRVVVVVALIGVAYLALINAALNLPATQALINQTLGGRIIVHWQRAWSIVPFRLTIEGLKVTGQSWSQQFDVSAPKVTGGIDVPSLFSQTLRFNDVETGDLVVRFRPRPRPDKDDKDLRPFYPEIPGFDPKLAADAVPKQLPGWLTVLDIARVGGSNDLWFAANRMTLVGEVSGLVVRQNKHGPLTLDNGRLDLSVQSFSVAGKEVSQGGSLAGRFSIASFLPQENRGVKVLPFLSLEADVDLPITGIDFLNFFLNSAADLTVGGNGRIKGHIAYARGTLTPGSDLTIEAEQLRVDLPPYSVTGVGHVQASVAPTTKDRLDASFAFSTISAVHEPSSAAMFKGENISIQVQRSPLILPDLNPEKVPRRVEINLPNVTVPDIASYQRYLPDEWNAELMAGEGSLDGKAVMSSGAAEFNLTLHSDQATVRLAENVFQSGFTLAMKAVGTADATTARVDLSGTYVELDDSRVSNRSGGESKPWQSRFGITTGEADFILPEEQDAKTGVTGFWSLFQNKELKSMLSDVSGNVQGALKVSDLDWISYLFRKPFSLAIADAAEVKADLTVKAGRIVADSSLVMAPRQFTLGILDYIIEGTGGFDLRVAKEGAKPDLRMVASLTGAALRLEDEKVAVVEDVTIEVNALAEGVSPKEGGATRTVEMNIPSARISDMTAYNTYLPKNTPFRILGGTANMSAKLVMTEDNATGFMKMTTSRVDADLDGDRMSGVIVLDIPVVGGSTKAKRFDISGSTLSIQDVRVTGNHATAGWGARIDVGKGSVVWKRPMTLNLSAAFRMTDASPILAVFDQNRKDNKWLDRLLDLKNINGKMTIEAEPDSLTIPYAFLTSNTFDVGAKGIFGKGGRQGVFYARTGKLAGVLAIDNKNKKFSVIDATGKFDAYRPGGPVPGIHDQARTSTPGATPASAPPARPKKKPFSLFKRQPQ